MQKTRKEKPTKHSPFVEKLKCRRSTRIISQNEEETFNKSLKPFAISTPKRENRHSKPFSENSENGSLILNSQKRYHKNYDPDIEIRQVNDRISKRTSKSWADQSFLNDEEEEDLIKYSEKIKNSQRNIKIENDVDILARRQNDIDKGKSKQCYKNFVYETAKELRKPYQPRTPNKFLKMSRRGWDGLVRKWKKHIHAWNEPKFEELYTAGIEMDCCNSDVASIASLKDSINDCEENLLSIVKDIDDEETLQGSRMGRKRSLSTNMNSAIDDNDEATLDKEHSKFSKLNELHTGLTNDAAALSVNCNKRIKLSSGKL